MSRSPLARFLVLAVVTLLFSSMVSAQTPALVKDIYPGFSSGAPFQAVEMNGVLYFSASDSGGRELWRSDGTAAGTWQVKDINPGGASSDPDMLTVAGNKLFFHANDGTHGKELWVSDGSNAGTFLLRDVRAGTATSMPASSPAPVVLNGNAYFIADDGVIGQELWISDGTVAGTQLFKEFNPSGPGCFHIRLAGGQIWLNGVKDNLGGEVWRSDGTLAGTVFVADVQDAAGVGSSPSNFTEMNGIVYFSAQSWQWGTELWRTDGTAAGTWLVKDIATDNSTGFTWSSSPSNLLAVGNVLFFTADDKVAGSEGADLWRTDGTAAGTFKLPIASSGSAFIGQMVDLNGTLLVFRTISSSQAQLWRSDGTVAGTTQIWSGSGGTQAPRSLHVADGSAFFFAVELMRTDGTAAGTTLHADFWSGGSSLVSPLKALNGRLYCSAYNSTIGSELWSVATCGEEPVITPSGPTTFCNGDSVTLTAPAGTAYLWSNGATTQSIVVSTTGTFTVTVTNADGCTATSDPVDVTVWGGPVGITFDRTGVCPDGEAYASVPDSFDSYSWSIGGGTIISGHGTPTVLFEPDGTSAEVGLSVELVGQGCTTYASAMLPLKSIEAPAITFDRPEVCPEGEAYASVPEGYIQYTWIITNGSIISGQGTDTIQFEPDGTGDVMLNVEVVDAEFCRALSSTASIPLKSIEAPSISFDRPEVCPDGEAYASVGEGYIQYTWIITNGSIIAGNGTSTIQFEPDGTGDVMLNVEVVDAEFCRALSSTASIPLKTIPPPTISVDRPEICPDGEAFATVPNNYSYYTWIITNGSIISGNGTNTIQFEPDGTGDVMLNVEVVDAEFCRALSSTASIPLKTIPPPTISVDRPEICPDGQAFATVPNNYSYYTWIITNGSIISGNGTNTIQFEPDGTGDVTLNVEVVDAEFCRALSSTASIPLKTIPPPVISVDRPEICPDGQAFATVPNSYSYYTWIITNGSIISGNGTNTIQFESDGTGDVTLNVEVVDSEACRALSTTASIPLKTIPPPAITFDRDMICLGSQVSASVPNSYSYYTWTITNGAIVSGHGTNAVTFEPDGTGDVILSVEVADSESCRAAATASRPLSTPEPATITPSGPTTFCEGDSVTLTAADGYTYLWSTGETTRSIVVTASGSYSVTVTYSAGCSATSAPTEVTVHPVPDGFFSDGEYEACVGEPIPLQGEIPGSGPVDILWSDGYTQHVEDPSHFTRWIITPAGTSTWSVVSVTNANGCSSALPGTVTLIADKVGPAAGIRGVLTYDEGVGSEIVSQENGVIEVCGWGPVDLVPEALDPSYTYSWSGGYSTAILTAYSPGYYSVVVTAPNGCSTQSTVLVNFTAYPEKPTVAAPVTELCPAGGSITLTASAAEGWLWSNGATTQSIVVTEPGTYTVRARTNLCYSQPSDPVVITTGTSTITTTGDLAVCENGSVTLTANDGTSWLWSTGATTRSIAVSEPGTYTVTTSNGGCIMAESAPVTVTQRTVEITPAGPTTICSGASVLLEASAGTSWLWSNGTTTPYVYATESGVYTVTATFADGCSVTSDPVVVDVRSPEATITAESPTTVCPGTAIEFASSVSGSGTFTYQWYSFGQPLEGETSPTLSYAPTSSGYVYLKVTDEVGCEDTSNAVTYTVHDTPEATITPLGETTFCEGGSVTLRASEGSAYSWSTGETTRDITVSAGGTYSVTVTGSTCGLNSSASIDVTVDPLPEATITPLGPTTFCQGGSVTLRASLGSTYLWSNGATTREITVSASGSYSVTVDDGTCSATSSATTVTVNPLPAATVTALGPTTFCEGGSVTLRASAGTSWLWSNGATTRDITVTASGSYSVTVNDGTCSATSAATTVTVNPLPTATITPLGSTTFCEGGSVTLRASLGSSYLWSNGATTRDITVSASGSYTVTVSDGTCSATSSATTVTVNALPAATITPLGPTTFCEGGSVTLRASLGSSYLWSNGATTRDITVSASGSYTVTVSDGTCSATSTATTVTVNPLPTATITPLSSTTFCEGGSVTLRASLGSSYLWSNGATTRDITVSDSGSYTVTVSDGTCSATSTATTVTVNPLPAATITPLGPTTFCEGDSVTLRGSAGTSWLWSNGATTRDITVSAAGSYTVTVSDGTCSATSSATTVTVNPLPAATITPLGPTTFCDGGSVTLRASLGSSYLWSNGATTRDITVNASGSYTVTVSDGTCSATSAPTTVTVNALPAATITPLGPTTFCEGGSVTLRASAGTSWLWSNGATTRDITVSAAGSYSVTVSNGTCSATSAPTTVTVNPLPAATITPLSSTTFCEGGSVTLRASAGTSWLWSNGATTRDITVSAAGSYSVSVSNGTCSATSAPTTVTVNPLPPATITVEGSLQLCPGASVTLRAPAGYSYLWSNGATGQSITVSAGGTYSVTVTSANGCSRTSSPVTVTNLPATAITTHPANVTMPRNQTRQLSVTATGAGTLQYQWYSVADDGTLTTLAGETQSTLTVGPYNKKGTHRFRVRVTSGTCTQSTVLSNIATVTVTN